MMHAEFPPLPEADTHGILWRLPSRPRWDVDKFRSP